MAANKIPLIFREEVVDLSNGTFEIPKDAVGVVLEMRSGENNGNISASFMNSGITIYSGMTRGGSGGHHYEMFNTYNIFFTDPAIDLLPRQVTLNSKNYSYAKVIRWIYTL